MTISFVEELSDGYGCACDIHAIYLMSNDSLL